MFAYNSENNKFIIREMEMIPVIKPSVRGLKDREKIYRILDEFEEIKDIYKERHKMERCFAWEDN